MEKLREVDDSFFSKQTTVYGHWLQQTQLARSQTMNKGFRFDRGQAWKEEVEEVKEDLLIIHIPTYPPTNYYHIVRARYFIMEVLREFAQLA